MAKNTIKVKKYLDIIEEYPAAAAITPGHLVELTNAGKVQKHSAEAGRAVPMFALEDELQGNGISDDYDAAAPVQVWIPNTGEMVYAILKTGENVSIGDFLVSKGDGTLKKVAEDTVADAQIIGVACEAVNAAAADARIIIRVA